MGLSAAWALLREGFAVRIVDQAPPPNPRGASVDDHRLIRHAYGAQAGYMRMVDAAYAAWDDLWSELGEVLHVPTGVLAIDEAGGAWMAASRAALRADGRAVTDLTRAEAVARFPFLSADGLAGAFWCPEGGVLLAERVVAGLARLVAGKGAVIETARAVRVDAAHASITLEDGSRRGADVLVVAAGPWIPRLLPAIGGRVTPSKQVLVRLAPPPEMVEAFAGAPMILDLHGGFYMVPPVAGTPLKIGDHSFSLAGDPDDPDRTPDPREAERILDLARRRIPALGSFRHLGAAVCFYDVEPDERFVVEKISRRAWVMSGFSGHGFKFGPILGRRLAEAIARPELEIFLPAWAAGDEVMAA